MDHVINSRHQQVASLKLALRDAALRLSLLSHHASGQLELKGSDLDCLEIIARHGPLGPGELARQAGLHPATMTGVLDRLERGRWIVRERDPADRRAVFVRALRDRNAEIFAVFAGMNRAMDVVCDGYSPEELRVIAGFLRATAAAGRDATAALTDGVPPA